MKTNQIPPIPTVPLTDASGNVSRLWFVWFNSLAKADGPDGEVHDEVVFISMMNRLIE